MSRKFLKILRNLVPASVSVLALLIAFLGTAIAEQQVIEPHRQVQTKQARRPAPPPRHDLPFKKAPGMDLEVRAVQYDGSTNGTLTVQVRNTTKTAQTFSAAGLYFVPQGDPDQAPQRLGAVGPMQAVNAPGKEHTQMTIAAGATVELNLDVFCIDSHRSSPTPQHKFAIGQTPLPKELATTIEKRAEQAVEEAKSSGHAAPRPAAKGKIQSEVWKSRDSKWVPLEGEGKQEIGKQRR